MKKLLLSASLLTAAFAMAQTGINTTAPATTLEVVAKNADGSTPEGVKIPQLTGDAVKAMTANLTAAQNGNIVYVTTPVTATDAATANMTFPGHYRFNFDTATSTKSWVRLEPSGLEKVSESGNTGWRLIGKNPAYYGNIGNDAIDLSSRDENSYSDYVKDADGNPILDSNGQPTLIYDGGATGDNSFAMGVNANATGSNAFAFGNNTIATGDNSIAIGNYSQAADFSIAIRGKAASSSYSLFGSDTKRPGSIAIGQGNKTLPDDPNFPTGGSGFGMAIGMDNTVQAQQGNAFGQSNEVLPGALWSFASGYHNQTTNQYEYAAGSINFSFPNVLFSVGNGYYSNNQPYVRHGSNAIVVMKGNSLDSWGNTNVSVDSYIGINMPINPNDNKDYSISAPTEVLDINGDVRLRGRKSSNYTFSGAGGACTNPGTITYQNDTFYGCKTTGWVQLNN